MTGSGGVGITGSAGSGGVGMNGSTGSGTLNPEISGIRITGGFFGTMAAPVDGGLAVGVPLAPGDGFVSAPTRYRPLAAVFDLLSRSRTSRHWPSLFRLGVR